MPVVCTGGFQTASVVAGGDRARRLRRRHDRPSADREPGPRAALGRAGHDRPPKPVHVLEQVPDQPGREPARLLRPEPLRLARGDGARDPLRLRPPVRQRVTDRDLRAAPLPKPRRSRTGSSARASPGASTTTTGRARGRGSTGSCKFARGGVGAIISSWCGVDQRGLHRPRTTRRSTSDATIPFWRELGERVHEHDCKYVLQLAHGGRQRDIRGSTSIGRASARPGSPIRCTVSRRERATAAQLSEIAEAFAAARARARARPASTASSSTGERLPLHAVPLVGDQRPRRRVRRLAREPRALPARDACGPSAPEVGDDFHLQVKISVDRERERVPAVAAAREHASRTPSQVCRWLEEAGVDAIHVSAGSTFPHPRQPGRRPAARGGRRGTTTR